MRMIILGVFLLFFGNAFSQSNHVAILPKLGIGLGDYEFVFVKGYEVDFQIKKNRLSYVNLRGSKYRREYANGDFKDLMIKNSYLKYSRIFGGKKVAVSPNLGIGKVTGIWTTTDAGGRGIDEGLGLILGFGIEYTPIESLIFKIAYDQTILGNNLSGNTSITGGIGIRIQAKNLKKRK